MEVRTWQCDIESCGAVRKNSNHWWMIMPLPDRGGFAVVPFDESEARRALAHLCGPAHAVLKMSVLMGEAIGPKKTSGR
jgi:hypothetical protein